MKPVLIAAAALGCLAALPVLAQRPAPGPPNPFQGNTEAIAQGKTVFEANCTSCHGLTGGGGEFGPALVKSNSPDTPRSPAQMFEAVKSGVSGTLMPAWGDRIGDDDIWKMVAYIQVLRGTAIDNPTPGDVAAGEQVFWGKGACGACHMVGGRGGLQGPELSNIAAVRKTSSIVDALTKPYHRVYGSGGAHLVVLPPQHTYLPTRVTKMDGTVVSGVLHNQDSYGLQIMGDDDQLHLYVRSKVRDIQIEPRSRMPTDYDKRLTPAEFSNLLAYLTRQANAPRPGAARP